MDENTKDRLAFYIQSIARGNTKALNEIDSLMRKIIYSIAFMILCNHEDAEDTVHEVYITIIRKARLFVARENAYAWINTITRNTALNKYKHRKICKEVPLNVTNDIKIIDNAYGVIVQEMLSLLNQEERNIVFYKYWYSLSLTQIGEIIKKPKSTTLYYINSIEDKIKAFYDIKK